MSAVVVEGCDDTGMHGWMIRMWLVLSILFWLCGIAVLRMDAGIEIRVVDWVLHARFRQADVSRVPSVSSLSSSPSKVDPSTSLIDGVDT